ncbi:MAG: alkaline phosphatase family protein [Deltaproteobacteria bacterium]
MKVVFIIEDSLPNRAVSPSTTPHLWKFMAAGACHAAGGRAVLSTATYPNHASFITGAVPEAHGVVTNRVWDGARFVCASGIGPTSETLFAAARRAGVSTSAVLGDQKLVGVMGAVAADGHWPPRGLLPEGTLLDEFQYATDAAVLGALGETAALEADLAVVHLNDPDTACHLFGPDSEEARVRFQATDAAFGQILEMLAPGWEDTIVFVVSDHDQETMLDEPAIDLAAILAERGLPGKVVSEGTTAQVVQGPTLDELRALPGVTGVAASGSGRSLVWGAPGTAFGTVDWRLKGGHGSPRTDTQVAAVGGGHPLVEPLGDSLRVRRPDATDWAPTMAALLGFALADATGTPLLAS